MTSLQLVSGGGLSRRPDTRWDYRIRKGSRRRYPRCWPRLGPGEAHFVRRWDARGRFGHLTRNPEDHLATRRLVFWVGIDASGPLASILGGHPRNEQLITVPVCMGAPGTVALRIARETYETAAPPLSYVGRSTGAHR